MIKETITFSFANEEQQAAFKRRLRGRGVAMHDTIIDKKLLEADDKLEGKMPTETTPVELSRGELRTLLKAMTLLKAVKTISK